MLEGCDFKIGKFVGGWNVEELCIIQDFYVKYFLFVVEGVFEVVLVGGFIKEYQIELNLDVMYLFNVLVMDVMNVVKKSNFDIGVEIMEVNKVEYLICGFGYVKNVVDIENMVVIVCEGVFVCIFDIVFVNIGLGMRCGGLDKEGVEVVGGVVIVCYGFNFLEVINNVKEKIYEMDVGMLQKILVDGMVLKVIVVFFYDWMGLIKEIIGILEMSFLYEILICIIVIIVLVFNLWVLVVIVSMLFIVVLVIFILM